MPDRCSTNGKNYYILTKAGKDFCKKCGVKHFISNGNSTFHNSKVSEYIANNLTKKEMKTCLSERELGNFLQSRLDEYESSGQMNKYYALKDAIDSHTLSFPDMVYFKQDGTIQAIEIITNNYKQEHIESKTQTAELLNIKINIIHTREV